LVKFDALKRPIVVLLTVPAFIALGIGLLPLVLVWAERQFGEGSLSPYVLHFGPDSARTILSVVAGGAMTALSLAYSLVLVVFTLAAGNIGPRLLKRFTSDLVNQVTAGIFGGTFLYALLTLLFVQADFVPKVTITGAGALAVLSVFQLIYFVRHVSISVTIDDEIAEITDKLSDALNEEYKSSAQSEETESEENEDFKNEICSRHSGYLNLVDKDELLSLAVENDTILKLNISRGSYLIKGECLFYSQSSLSDEAVEECLDLVRVEPSRSTDNKVEFSLNLLVEISLRALSPGVNDTFTALAAVDSLSGALSEIVCESSLPIRFKDQDDQVRLILPASPPSALVSEAFCHLRRETGSNILMAEGLARAMGRLYLKATKEVQSTLEQQIVLLFKELRKSKQFDEDIAIVQSYLPPELLEAVSGDK